MRLFIAVGLPEDVRNHIRDLQQYFSSSEFRCVRPENCHLTLKFLGDADPETIAETLGNVSADAFEVRLDHLSGFPDLNRPRVIFLGGSSDGFRPLADAVHNATPGFKRDHAPKLHATIARVKGNPEIPDLNTGEFFFTVSEFVLYASELTPQGPRYKALRRFSLTAR